MWWTVGVAPELALPSAQPALPRSHQAPFVCATSRLPPPCSARKSCCGRHGTQPKRHLALSCRFIFGFLSCPPCRTAGLLLPRQCTCLPLIPTRHSECPGEGLCWAGACSTLNSISRLLDTRHRTQHKDMGVRRNTFHNPIVPPLSAVFSMESEKEREHALSGLLHTRRDKRRKALATHLFQNAASPLPEEKRREISRRWYNLGIGVGVGIAACTVPARHRQRDCFGCLEVSDHGPRTVDNGQCQTQ
jgi:hypothetical protein